MQPRFEHKIILVTGGSSGIGFATAARLLDEGAATVFITGRREAELTEAVAKLGPRAIGVPGDIANHADLARLFATIQERAGRLDAVVANAGGGSHVPLGEYTDALLDERYRINVKGTAFTVQGALPLLGQVQVVLGDSSFAGLFADHLRQQYGLRVEKPTHVVLKKRNFCLHKQRWLVERTLAWLSANRRLSTAYDRPLTRANT